MDRSSSHGARLLARQAGSMPSAAQTCLLRACITQDDSWVTPWTAWRRDQDADRIDALSLNLLPLIYWKVGSAAVDDPVLQRARSLYLAVLAQNLRRASRLVEVLQRFADAGMATMLLKGAALSAACYPSQGVRDMGDIDLLVPLQDVHLAAELLQELGWRADGRIGADEIVSAKTRIRHGWSFSLGPDHSLDLHWRPGPFCMSPQIIERFWQASRPISLRGAPTHVMGATDQFLHVCAHAVEWAPAPSIRWIADAMTVLHGPMPIEWPRLAAMAREANVTVRLRAALECLRKEFAAPVPAAVVDQLAAAPVPRWERAEYALQSRRVPLAVYHRLRRHSWRFRRLRRFDAEWREQPALIGFVGYLRLRGKARATPVPAAGFGALTSLGQPFRPRSSYGGPPKPSRRSVSVAPGTTKVVPGE